MEFDVPLQSVLVTGGCGFLGHHIVSGILESEPGCSVAVLGLNNSRNRAQGVHYHQCDLADKSSIQSVLHKLDPPPRVVFHAACCRYDVKDQGLSWRVNADGTKNFIESLQELGTVKALVYTSTPSVVHNNNSNLIDADESLPLLKPPEQTLTYSLTKAIAEEHVIGANRKDGILTAVVRPTTMFGPRNNDMLGRFVGFVHSGKAKYRMGNPSNPFDFLYVKNAVHAHLLLAKRLLWESTTSTLPPGERAQGEAFFITNDEHTSFWGFPLAVAKALGKPVNPKDIVDVPRWLAYVVAFISECLAWLFSAGCRKSNVTVDALKHLYTSRTFKIDKAKRILGYQPVYTVEEGIQESLKGYATNHKKKD